MTTPERPPESRDGDRRPPADEAPRGADETLAGNRPMGDDEEEGFDETIVRPTGGAQQRHAADETPDAPEGAASGDSGVEPGVDATIEAPLPGVDATVVPTREGSDGEDGDDDLDQTMASAPRPADPAPADLSAERRAAAARAGDTRERPKEGDRPAPPPSGVRLSPAESALIGRRLGDCMIESAIGRGAMGAVFRARQLHLDRTVAVKTIRPDRMLDDGLVQRFQREARALSRFTNPHVVQVYGAGEEHGLFYIVMEFVSGGTLGDYAENLPEQRIPERDAIRFMRECVIGLQEAERHNILHRDIKPDNVLLDDQGRAKLSDFGIAKVRDEEIQLTMSMDQVGTPLYMSPEQCRGIELDFRSDMYSLGATFFYLITNVPPAKGSSLIELIQTKTTLSYLSPARELPEMDADSPFSRVIERMTALERDDRYGSWAEVLADLEHIGGAGRGALPSGTGHSVIVPERDSGAREDERPDNRPGVLKFAAAAVALLVLGGGAIAWSQGLVDGERIAGWFGGAAPTDDVADPPSGNPDTTVDDTPPIVIDDDPPSDPPNGGPDAPPVVVDDDPDATLGNGPALVDDDSATDPPAGGFEPADADVVNVPGAPVARGIEEARALLASYEDTFERNGPTSNLDALVTAYLTKDTADSPEHLEIRRGMTDLSSRIETARTALDGLKNVQTAPPPRPPFVQLAQYVARCREYLDALRLTDGTLPTWAQDDADRRLDEGKLLDEACIAFAEAVRLLERDIPVSEQDVARGLRTDRLRSDLGALRDGIERLDATFPAFAETAEAKSAEETLARLEAKLVRVEELVPLEQDLRSLENRLAPVETLAGWRALLAGENPIVAQLEDWQTRADAWQERHGESVGPFLAERRALERRIEDWTTWDDRVATASADIASDGVVATAAESLRRPLNGDRPPADVRGLADTLERASTVFVQLAEDGDIRRASKELDAAVGGGDGPLDLLSAGARGRLRSSRAALRDLTSRADGMVPVPAGRVRVTRQTSSGRETEEVDVSAFLISRTEVSASEWLRFLEAMRPKDGWEQIQSEHPGVWRDEGSWELAQRLYGSLRNAARTEPDVAADRICFEAAAAYARYRGAALPTHAQWWLAARGPIGGETEYPWGDNESRRTLASDLELFNFGNQPVAVDDGGVAHRFRKGDTVHHLAGNVSEWLEPEGDDDGFAYMIGGSYRSNDRTAERAAEYAGERLRRSSRTSSDRGNGVRLVLDPKAALGADWLGPR